MPHFTCFCYILITAVFVKPEKQCKSMLAITAFVKFEKQYKSMLATTTTVRQT